MSRRLLKIFALNFFCFLPVSAGDLRAKFLPPEGKILLMVGQDIKNINDYLDAINVVPAGFSVYTSAEFAEGLETADDNGGGIQHAQSLVAQPKS